MRMCRASVLISTKVASVHAHGTSVAAAGHPAVARVTRYYEARAPEYDQTTYELARRTPAAALELNQLQAFVAGLPAARVLDAGCGTGWLTRLLRGHVVALDASAAMLRRARSRLDAGLYVLAAVPPLPFLERSFDRLFASNLYSHLPDEHLRSAFLRQALRVVDELVVIEEACGPDGPRESWQRRPLTDGTHYDVYKRYLDGPELAEELGGRIVLETPSWIAVRVGAR